MEKIFDVTKASPLITTDYNRSIVTVRHMYYTSHAKYITLYSIFSRFSIADHNFTFENFVH